MERGISIANSVTGFASFLALNSLLRRKHGDLSLKPVTIGFVKSILAGGLMGAATWGVYQLMGGGLGDTIARKLALVFVPIAAGVVVYLTLARLLGMDEARLLLRRRHDIAEFQDLIKRTYHRRDKKARAGQELPLVHRGSRRTRRDRPQGRHEGTGPGSRRRPRLAVHNLLPLGRRPGTGGARQVRQGLPALQRNPLLMPLAAIVLSLLVVFPALMVAVLWLRIRAKNKLRDTFLWAVREDLRNGGFEPVGRRHLPEGRPGRGRSNSPRTLSSGRGFSLRLAAWSGHDP